MILLGNGKSSWYQWDINQRIIITDIEIDQIEGQEIHFSSDVDTDTTAQVTIPYVENGIVYAPVPNILLTISGTIHIYLYVSNGTEAHTEVHKAVKVVAREKPSDYVYTETEVKTWEELNERLKNAVYYTPEERTEEEKAQARENIGVPQSDYTQNDSTKPDYIKNRPGGYLGEQNTYKLDITGVKQDGIDELTDVSVLQDDFMHMSSINVEISHSYGTINRTLTQREIGQYIINTYGAQIYGNAHLISPSQPDTGEDMALYKEMDSQSNYSIGWHVWATSVPSGDVEVCVVEKTMNAVRFDPEFIPWYASPTKDAVLYTAQSLTDDQKNHARANIGAGTPYTLPEASSDALGGIKADAAETADTQPVRIGVDGKLYTAPGGGGADISLGISGATAGQMAKVKAVDASGAPTAWEAGDAASGESEWRLIRDVQIEEDVTSVYISDDDDGNPFSLKKIACVIYSDGGTGMTSTAYMKCAFNTTSMTENRFLDIKDVFKPYGSHCALIFVTNFDGPFVYTECIKYGNNGKPFDNAGNTVFNYTSSSVGGLISAVAPAERLTSLLIYNDSSATLRAGSRIQLYGVKA